jgi:hypothetical protein
MNTVISPQHACEVSNTSGKKSILKAEKLCFKARPIQNFHLSPENKRVRFDNHTTTLSFVTDTQATSLAELRSDRIPQVCKIDVSKTVYAPLPKNITPKLAKQIESIRELARSQMKISHNASKSNKREVSVRTTNKVTIKPLTTDIVNHAS